MRRLTAALACSALIVASGCGGDEEASDTGTTPAPELTIPRETTPDTTTERAPTPRQTETTPPSGDPNGGSPAPPAQDSPQNDTPPPANSPAQRFEKFCEENPGACG